MSDCQIRSSSPSSIKIDNQAVMWGRFRVAPVNCRKMALEGMRFMIKRKMGRPPSVVPDFCTPNMPLWIFWPLNSATSSRGIQLQTPLSTNASAILSRSDPSIWIFPCSPGKTWPVSSTTILSGFSKKKRVVEETKSRTLIEPPCCIGGREGITWSKVKRWQTPTSSPM